MPRRCTVCDHADRAAIDQALVNHRPFRALAAQFSLSSSSLQRHHDEHIARELFDAAKGRDNARAASLAADLALARSVTVEAIQAARQAGDWSLVLRGVDRLCRHAELAAKAGEVGDTGPALLASAEWLQIRTAMMVALRDFPGARQAVSAALGSLD